MWRPRDGDGPVIERAVSAGKVAALPALENGHAIEEDLAKLEAFADRGIRYMTLCHSRHLPWCASSGDDGVAFGSDFDGVPELPRGVGGADAFPAILARLRERGWSEERRRKLAWDNVLRVLRDNE